MKTSSEKKKKLWPFLLLVILAVILAIFLFCEYKEEKKAKKQEQELEETQRPIRVELERKKRELDALEKEYSRVLSGSAVSGIIISGLDSRIYTEIYPLINEYGYTATLAVSGSCISPQEEQLAEERMTWEQLQELLDMGWYWCPAWEAGDDLAAIRYVQENMPADDSFLEGVVYFAEGAYTGEYDTELSENGFELILHHGEEGLELNLIQGEQMNYIGASGLQGNMARYWLENSVAEKGVIFNAVGFKDSGEMYERSKMESMLEALQEFETQGDLIITNPKEALGYKQDKLSSQEEAKEEYEGQVNELEQEIQELEQQLQ